MNDSKREPNDPTSIRSADAWWRALLSLPIGAIAGLICAYVILYFRGIDAGVHASVFAQIAEANREINAGALLGAIYLPIGYLMFLRKEQYLPALVAICLVTIFFGVLGFMIGGTAIPVSLDASVGFWITCIAFYARRERPQRDAGFGGYFDPPLRRK